MNANISVLILGLLFIILLIIRIRQNRLINKNSKIKKSVLDTKELANVLFNVSLLSGGVASIFLSSGYGTFFFGQDLSFSQPIINFLAGVLFIWFSIRNIFYGGKL